MRTIKKVLPRSKRDRFLLFLLGSGLLGLGLSFYDHHRYWKGTIKAVETTELNILSHNLPTKLSLLVKNQDTEEINQVFDSAYGFIGLVITDCQSLATECDEEILYQAKMNKGWKKNFNSKALQEFPYDPLFDPPPLKTEGNYDHPYDHQRNPTGETNQGEIIGRVYYIRSIPPTFWEGLINWGSTSRNKILGFLLHPYTFNFTIFLVGGFISWRFMERELYQIESINSTQRKQAQAEINRLEQRNQSLEKEKENLRHQITALQEEREEQEAQVRQQEDLIAQQNEEVRREREQLNQKEISLQSLKETNLTTQEELNTREQEIDSLRKDLTRKEDTLKEQKLGLRQIQQSLEKAQNQERRLKQRLEEKEQKEQSQINQLEELRKQQKQKEQDIKKKEQDIKEWADLAEDAWQEREQLEKKLEEQKAQIEEYEDQIFNYEDEINDRVEQLNQLYQYQGQDNSSLNQSQSNEAPWSICYTDTFAEWWQELDSTTHDRLLRIIRLLEREGVTLGFPHSSDVRGTQHSRIRELRVGQTDPYRIFYAFDNNQVPILLIGGNKTGKDDQPWYRKYGTLADEEYNKHLDNLKNNSYHVYKNLGNLL